MSIKLIIFDFDGTLGDTRRNIVTTMQMTIKELQLPSRTEAECAATRAKTCGVTWGNGTREDLKNSGADFIIDRMEELIRIV